MLTIHRIDSELTNLKAKTFEEAFTSFGKATIELPHENITKLHIYTGIIAPTATAYIDVYFSDNTKRIFLICGHPNAIKTGQGALELGIKVESELNLN